MNRTKSGCVFTTKPMVGMGYCAMARGHCGMGRGMNPVVERQLNRLVVANPRRNNIRLIV